MLQLSNSIMDIEERKIDKLIDKLNEHRRIIKSMKDALKETLWTLEHNKLELLVGDIRDGDDHLLLDTIRAALKLDNNN